MKVELHHSLKDTASLLGVGFQVRGGDKEVVHIDNEPSFSDHVSERVIYEPLEHSGGVAETKEHDRWFEESLVGDEGCLPLVTILDTDIIVSPSNIEFGKVASIF